MACESHRAFLPAYVDGELDLVRQLEIEAHLRTCPACGQAVDSLRAAKQALRTALPHYSAPPDMLRKIQAALPPSVAPAPVRRSIVVALWPHLGLAASLAAMLLVGYAIGWQHGQSQDLTDVAIASHTRSLMAAHLMDVASTDQHTVKPWFAGKIDFAPPVVDLAAAGYPLIGGRLDLLGHQPAAALVYQRHKHIINLFVWAAAFPAAPGRTTHAEGYQTIAWSRDGLNYLAVSEIPEADLAEFVQDYRAQTGG